MSCAVAASIIRRPSWTSPDAFLTIVLSMYLAPPWTTLCSEPQVTSHLDANCGTTSASWMTQCSEPQVTAHPFIHLLRRRLFDL